MDRVPGSWSGYGLELVLSSGQQQSIRLLPSTRLDSLSLGPERSGRIAVRSPNIQFPRTKPKDQGKRQQASVQSLRPGSLGAYSSNRLASRVGACTRTWPSRHTFIWAHRFGLAIQVALEPVQLPVQALD